MIEEKNLEFTLIVKKPKPLKSEAFHTAVKLYNAGFIEYKQILLIGIAERIGIIKCLTR